MAAALMQRASGYLVLVSLHMRYYNGHAHVQTRIGSLLPACKGGINGNRMQGPVTFSLGACMNKERTE